MRPHYYVVDTKSGKALPAIIREAVQSDFEKTRQDHWQTSWLSDYIQQVKLEKYALEVEGSGELVGLGAYRNMPEGVLVYVEYIESAPSSNPTLVSDKHYLGIGAALLAYGIQLSIDYGYGGAIYLKAKTEELRRYYMKEFGAIPFSRRDPFMLLIEGDSAQVLFAKYLKED